MTNDTSPIVIEPPGNASASVIWLHGLGANGHDFEPIVKELEPTARDGVRFVFPNAPEQAVTINSGAVMPAWYDIRGTDLEREPDKAGVEASVAIVNKLIETELSGGIACERIVLAGFSQGGAIVLQAGTAYPQRLGGIMALSTYVAIPEAITAPKQPGLPIFVAHGSQDPMIPLAVSERSQALLMSLGYTVERHTYAMPHSVCAEQIRDISNWLTRILANT